MRNIITGVGPLDRSQCYADLVIGCCSGRNGFFAYISAREQHPSLHFFENRLSSKRDRYNFQLAVDHFPLRLVSFFLKELLSRLLREPLFELEAVARVAMMAGISKRLYEECFCYYQQARGILPSSSAA